MLLLDKFVCFVFGDHRHLALLILESHLEDAVGNMDHVGLECGHDELGSWTLSAGRWV